MTAMISVADAQARILAQITTVAPPHIVPVPAALGRVLAEDLCAPIDVPPTDNSAVDGYAVAHAPIPSGERRELTVVGELAAGGVFEGASAPAQALPIMTGAPRPAGADTVYPQEVVERAGARITVGPIEHGVNTRCRGEDVRAGSVVVATGAVARPQRAEVRRGAGRRRRGRGVAASLGFPQILVRQRPRVAILSTGDEVVEPGETRKPGQIFDSNRFSLHRLLAGAGGTVTDYGIVPDLQDVLHARLTEAARAADIVLTSGGVSVGDYDLVKAVLQEAGGIDSGQVAMRPGRPLAVGRIGATQFFGLPGNPVASMLTFSLFVRPALWKLAGRRALFPAHLHAVAPAA